MALLFVALAIVDTHGAEVDTWIGRLVEDDPFSREEAAAEIRRLGPDALEPLARALESETLELRLRADRLFRETAAGFLIELENEYRALELDRRERDHLEERAKLREELVELRDRVARWKEDHPDLDAAVETYLTWKAFDTRKRALPEGESLSAEDEAKLGELEPQVRALETRIEELAQKSDLVARYYRLELQGDMLADPKEVEALRLADLRERIAAGEPTVDALLGRARRIGAPLWAVIAARRSSLPLRDVSILGDLRSPVLALYDRLIDEAREGAPAVWQDPPAEVFDRDRYFLSWYWEAELAARSSRMEKAQALLDRHIDATIADLEAPALLLRERAEIELYRMRKLGWSRLAERIGIEDVTRLTGGERSPHAFLACLLRWRISPEVYARVNLHFGDYKGLGFPARRRKIFQFARAAGQDAIPTLRAIVVDDELEQSFLVKYAAAKALAFQLGDQLGYVVLKSLHPNLVVKQPEIAREIHIIQGQALIRERDYARAVEEFAKILDVAPFDFEGNYHTAFAYLLLKNYPKAIHHFEIARRVRPRDPLTLYNLACAYSLHGDTNEALDALSASIDSGFSDPEHMKKDQDLDPIRNHPRFADLLRKATEKQGTTPR